MLPRNSAFSDLFHDILVLLTHLLRFGYAYFLSRKGLLVCYNDFFQAWRPPFDLTVLDKLKNDVHLLPTWVIDNLEETDHVLMSSLLQDGNLFLHSIFGSTQFAKPTLSRVSGHDFDRDENIILDITPFLNLAVLTLAELFQNLVAIDQFIASVHVMFNLGSVSLLRCLQVRWMQVRTIRLREPSAVLSSRMRARCGGGE